MTRAVPQSRRSRFVLGGVFVVAFAIAGVGFSQLPAIGAGALLHPARQPVVASPPMHCIDSTFAGAGVALKGWACHTPAKHRGTIVVLHGVADNHAGAAGIIERYLPRGFDLIAYDSRAHGESDGDACTYGFFEKDDLKRVIDTIGDGPVVLLGASLGAAVALQEAADDPRVRAVVAAESFSDLRTVAVERAPWVFTQWSIRRAFEVAEREGRFRVDDVSPERAASQLSIPVLLVHGADDVDTPPDHSRRIYNALKGPKRLILVPGAGHNHSLQESVWPEIDSWIDRALTAGL
jgi:pimeloyl-ACP methyl ester carboxylesterase